MHGKMTAEDKDTVMNNFSKIGSEISILVATTVIEVNNLFLLILFLFCVDKSVLYKEDFIDFILF